MKDEETRKILNYLMVDYANFIENWLKDNLTKEQIQKGLKSDFVTKNSEFLKGAEKKFKNR